MPHYRHYPLPSAQAFTTSGAISLEIAPTPITITRMAIVIRASITTGSATNFNDYWDRMISSLTLNWAGHTVFSFQNMRPAYHHTRFVPPTTKRPTVIANGVTDDVTQQPAYIFHFGVAPLTVDQHGMVHDNPFDLTAGIPPVGVGNLTLTGNWPAFEDTMGTNVDIADAPFDVYLWGIQPLPTDPPELWMPRAIPSWQMSTPTPTATSSPFATIYNIPAGGHLHSMTVMLTNGTNAPRQDDILNSLRLYSAKEARSIITYGGQASGVQGLSQYQAAEILSQQYVNGWVPTDDSPDGTLGVPSVLQGRDSGLVHFPIARYIDPRRPMAEYGADLRQLATGDLQLNQGVEDATGINMFVLMRKYNLYAEHPASAALL